MATVFEEHFFEERADAYPVWRDLKDAGVSVTDIQFERLKNRYRFLVHTEQD